MRYDNMMDFLYRFVLLCNDYDISCEITKEGLCLKCVEEVGIGYINTEPFRFKKLYTLVDIDRQYSEIDDIVNDFLAHYNSALEEPARIG